MTLFVFLTPFMFLLIICSSLGKHRVDKIVDSFLGHGTHKVDSGLAVLEGTDIRDRGHTVLHGQVLMHINVDLGQRHLLANTHDAII